MTHEEAKIILQAYRPNGQDADLPEFAHALELLKQDKELREWFEAEQAIDRAIAEKINAQQAPKELLASILVANKITRPRQSSWSGGVVKWAAAVVVIGAILWSAFLTSQSDSLSEYRSEVLAHLRMPGQDFNYQSRDFGQLKSWLDDHGVASINVESIEPLTSLPTHGCKVMQWGEQKVTLICFDLANHGSVHLFVFHEMNMTDPEGLQEPRWQEAEGWTTVGWTQDSDLFMLAAHIPMKELRQYL